MSTDVDFVFPAADAAPLRGGQALRWGIAGPGRIASHFVRALQAHTDQQVVAVGSRSRERAESFAIAQSLPHAWGSYDALVSDPDVDIVYIATPNSEHARLAMLAIEAGKHVLVEKPMGSTAPEVAAIASAAQSAGVFAMEGMWSAFLPRTLVVKRILDSGVLGDIKLVTADFGECFDPVIEASVFDPGMSGGALRDVGIYPVWFAHFVLGRPDDIVARGVLTETGVDGQVALILGWRDGAQAQLSTSMFAESASVATIAGTRGRIEFTRPFLMPGGFMLSIGSAQWLWRDESGLEGLDGLAWQAVAIAEHLHRGLIESPLHPLAVTLEVTNTLDRARAQVFASQLH